MTTQEHERLKTDGKVWRGWGPYLSERAWGTVREDYSANGDAWNYFPHDHARARAYRWNEDGLAGISDDEQRLCFSLALWNGHDPILKERLFGLTNTQGNHGEDVKEAYFYLDNTPSHSYMRMLYKYPQTAYPYSQLIEENARRTRDDDEFELEDTGIFDDNRYFDVFVEYAKAAPSDILISIEAVNRGAEATTLSLLPTLWFRNIWSWTKDAKQPEMHAINAGTILANHYILEASERKPLGTYRFACENADRLLFTNNDTNAARIFNVPNATPYVKDAFHEYVIHNNTAAVNPEQMGTKACALYQRSVAPGETLRIRLRLTRIDPDQPDTPTDAFGSEFDEIITQRKREADEFYAAIQPPQLPPEQRTIQRQAYAGMLWSKQFYHYIVEQWLEGDPAQPPPPPERLHGRNSGWQHIYNNYVLSMPDTWEYPWYAAWDLAFHCIVLASIDAEFAKHQLLHLMREWFQHPSGQLPAYEWNFGDVNPPIFAFAAMRIYEVERDMRRRLGEQDQSGDHFFLERVFHKLLLNFTWWVNRKDSEGKNIFEGGFLGLDNIGVFDRSKPLPEGKLEQSDGTSWMGMNCLCMMKIALELARTDQAYEDIATKFFEHFMYIAKAMNNLGGGISLWNEQDEFFYDVWHMPDDNDIQLKVRSIVGLIPLLAVETVESRLIETLPSFKYHLEWFLNHRPDLAQLVAYWHSQDDNELRLLALTHGHRMKALLKRMLDPNEFFSDYGIRSLSKYHAAHPYTLHSDGTAYTIDYEPANSRSGLFGGNSNWRGPVWFPLNYLLIEALRRFHHYYGDDFRVECPTGSGTYLTLGQIADDLSRRLIRLFERDGAGNRPCNGTNRKLQRDPYWRDYLLFHEFFHGETGAGLGASHQTGWTGLVATLIEDGPNPAPDGSATLP